MRTILLIFFFRFSLLLQAEQFTVFEIEGLYGLKNNEGEVTIPAIYEEIGWSDGSKSVLDGIIGIRKGKNWGLVTVKNKPVSERLYHSITPLGSTDLKASVRGKFSNELFFGILDHSGRVKISFNYFSIEPFDGKYLVSNYHARTIKYGLISVEEEMILPVKYESVSEHGNFYFGETKLGEIDVYTRTGQNLERNIDSIRHTSRGLVCYKEGFAGFFDVSGKRVEDFIHKEIEVQNDVIFTYPFPIWEVLKGHQRTLRIAADSLQLKEGELWVAFNNGAYHFTLSDSIFSNSNYEIKGINNGHLIVKNGQNEAWSVIGQGGQSLISANDSIIGNGEIYWAKSEGGWQLYSSYGKKRHTFKVNSLSKGMNGQYIAKINEYCGLIDRFGFEVTPFKYEAILPASKKYKVKYLGKWGVMNERGGWELPPEFQEVFCLGDFEIGRKGLAFTYHSGDRLWKSTSKPSRLLNQDYLEVINESGFKNVLDKNLELVISGAFKEIESIANYFVTYSDSSCSLHDKQGHLIVHPSENIQQVKGLNENFFLTEKDGRWGFLDLEGRMRVSNRYENADVFSEGLAPIKLRGHWGFIDKEERLVIQPLYDHVSSFSKGLSIVEKNNRKGLIDKEGREIVTISWKEIKSTSFGNFIVIDNKHQYGLVSGDGQFLLRSDFDHLEDIGDKVIVTKSGKKGILEYSGRELFQIAHKDLKISGDFILLKH